MSKQRTPIHVHSWGQSIESTTALLSEILPADVAMETSQQMQEHQVEKTIDELGNQLQQIAEGAQPTHYGLALHVINPNTITHHSDEGQSILRSMLRASMGNDHMQVLYGENLPATETLAWTQALEGVGSTQVVVSKEALKNTLQAFTEASQPDTPTTSRLESNDA